MINKILRMIHNKILTNYKIDLIWCNVITLKYAPWWFMISQPSAACIYNICTLLINMFRPSGAYIYTHLFTYEISNWNNVFYFHNHKNRLEISKLSNYFRLLLILRYKSHRHMVFVLSGIFIKLYPLMVLWMTCWKRINICWHAFCYCSMTAWKTIKKQKT
jgi:hypothetical protein